MSQVELGCHWPQGHQVPVDGLVVPPHRSPLSLGSWATPKTRPALPFPSRFRCLRPRPLQTLLPRSLWEENGHSPPSSDGQDEKPAPQPVLPLRWASLESPKLPQDVGARWDQGDHLAQRPPVTEGESEEKGLDQHTMGTGT